MTEQASVDGSSNPCSLDVGRARRETPGCATVTHFNNAGAALMPLCVVDAVVNHLRLEAEIGGYEAEAREADRLENFYKVAAELLNASEDEIAFVENATRAWDMAFYSLDFKPGDRILTARAEYASNYIAYLQIARRTGVTVEAVPNDEHGQLSVEALREMIDDRVKLIAMTHIPTNGGLVNPAEAVGKVAREAGVLYLLDACQAAGQLPLDVEAIGCDILSATGRKYLRGPRDTGLLYMRRELLERTEPVFLDLHSANWVAADRYEIRPDARRFENWEQFHAGKLGLAEAIQYALAWGIGNIWERVRHIGGFLRESLREISGVTVRDMGEVQCGIVTFDVAGVRAEEIKRALAAARINVTVSKREYARLDMDERGLDEIVRASVHYYNTEEEIGGLCEVVRGLANHGVVA